MVDVLTAIVGVVVFGVAVVGEDVVGVEDLRVVVAVEVMIGDEEGEVIETEVCGDVIIECVVTEPVVTGVVV